MSFRSQRPAALAETVESLAGTELRAKAATARRDSRACALPTKNTFIEFPVSVGQLDALQSPVGTLRPYTTPAWMQTDLAASLIAATNEEEVGIECPRTPSPQGLQHVELLDLPSPGAGLSASWGSDLGLQAAMHAATYCASGVQQQQQQQQFVYDYVPTGPVQMPVPQMEATW